MFRFLALAVSVAILPLAGAHGQPPMPAVTGDCGPPSGAAGKYALLVERFQRNVPDNVEIRVWLPLNAADATLAKDATPTGQPGDAGPDQIYQFNDAATGMTVRVTVLHPSSSAPAQQVACVVY